MQTFVRATLLRGQLNSAAMCLLAGELEGAKFHQPIRFDRVDDGGLFLVDDFELISFEFRGGDEPQVLYYGVGKDLADPSRLLFVYVLVRGQHSFGVVNDRQLAVSLVQLTMLMKKYDTVTAS